MKNKSLAIVASILLSAGIAFAFVGANGSACCSPESCCSPASCNMSEQTCCDMPCPIPCCED